MDNTQYSAVMLHIFKAYAANLRFRVLIIEATGKRGQADDIRAVTAKIHTLAREKAEAIISEWEYLPFSEKLSNFDGISKYVSGMSEMEDSALNLLKSIQERLLSKNVPAALLEEAVKIHEIILRHTDGMQAMIDWAKVNMPEGMELIKSKNNSFLDKELSQLRDSFIATLRANNSGPSGPKL